MPELHIEHRLGDANIEEALAIRREVFVEDQNVPEELEIDGLDNAAEHYIGYVDERAVSTARIRLDDKDEHAKIERVSVLSKYQGNGYGKALMVHILSELETRGVIGAHLESQVHARRFYERLGFSAVGETFMDAGIPHIKMKKLF